MSTRGCQKKTQDFKTRTPYNIRGLYDRPFCGWAHEGLTFLHENYRFYTYVRGLGG